MIKHGDNSKEVVIFGIGDIHAQVDGLRVPQRYPNAPPPGDPTRGGLKALSSALIARGNAVKIEKHGTIALTLHNGDMLDTKGKWGRDKGIEATNFLKDVFQSCCPKIPLISTVGNHDARFGYVTFVKYYTQLHPVVVCHNLQWQDHDFFGIEYHFIMNEINFIILGLTHKSIDKQLSDPNFKSLITYDSVLPLDILINKLRHDTDQNKFGVFLAVTHLDRASIQSQHVFESIDLIIGGHDHSPYPGREFPVRITNYVNPAADAHFFAESRILAHENKRAELTSAELIPIYGESDEVLEEIDNIYYKHFQVLWIGPEKQQLTEPAGWIQKTLHVNTSQDSDFYCDDCSAGRFYASIFFECGKDLLRLQHLNGIVIGVIPASHFRDGELVGIEDLQPNEDNDFCIKENALSKWDIRSFVPDENKFVLLQIKTDDFRKVLHDSIFRKSIGHFLHLFGCDIYVDSDPLIFFPAEYNTHLWIATSSRVLEEKSYTPFNKIVSTVINSGQTIPDIVVDFFLRKSLKVEAALPIPDRCVAAGAYKHIADLGSEFISKIPFKWADVK